uniref:Phosphatidic acid phosphatase type 2/haloperoxidase domain-containing protein n=1 Tax=Globodera rostochiensis TaxID=31243 RepID=A0A914I8L1_GLORO
MMRPTKIKGRMALNTVGTAKTKSKRRCTEKDAIHSPFFRPKKCGRLTKSVNDADVFDLALLAPNRESDLALHRMKLEELKKWLRSTMAVHRGQKTLLLTGPSGSGKISALRVLCAEFGIEVIEFDCTEEFGGETAIFNGAPTCSKRSGESQFDGFMQFLRANEFSSIQNMSLKHRLLLVGQLPNAFYRDPSKLHSVLADVLPSSRCLVAFVLANVDACWELSPFRLFPSLLLEQLQITHIKFNPIASSLLTTAIERIFRLLDLKWNAKLVTQIVSCANGDIRRALNTLLFSLIRIQKDKRVGNESGRPQQLSGDKPLELFHFIGKVLYAKRMEKKNAVQIEQWKCTEQRLGQKVREKYGRPLPPKDDLNQLIASAPISGQCLIGFVFEHEPRFTPSLSVLAKMSSTIAGLDLMNRQFGVEYERLMDKYATDIVIRSSLFHNYRPAIEKSSFRQTFYQFEKPRFREVDIQRHDQRLRMAQEIGMERTAQMETLIVPLLTHIRANGAASEWQRQTLCRLGSKPFAENAIVPCQVRGTSKPDDSYYHDIDESDGFNYDIDDTESGDESSNAENRLQFDVSRHVQAVVETEPLHPFVVLCPMPLRPARSRSDIFGGSSSHLAMTDPISAAKYQINYFLLPNFIIHVIGLAALWALWYYLRFTNVFPYHHRVFYCRDVDLFKPNFAPEDFEVFISYALLYVLGFTIPPIIMLVGEVMFWLFSTKPRKVVYATCRECKIALITRRLFRFISVFMFGALVTQIFVDTIKLLTGYQRPYFLSLCNVSLAACTAPLEHSPSPSPHLACNYRNADELRYAWLTFPSLHAAFSSYSACFASCYIYYMINLRGAPLLRPMLIFGLVGLDIWVGWLIGFAIAVFLCYCVLCFQEIYHIVYRASEMPAALEPAETVQPPFFSWFRLPRVRAPSVKEEYVVYEEDVPVDDTTIHQQPVDGGRHRKRDRTYEVTTTTESFHRTIVPPGGGTAQRQNAGSARAVGGMGSSHNGGGGGGAYAAAY